MINFIIVSETILFSLINNALKYNIETIQILLKSDNSFKLSFILYNLYFFYYFIRIFDYSFEYFNPFGYLIVLSTLDIQIKLLAFILLLYSNNELFTYGLIYNLVNLIISIYPLKYDMLVDYIVYKISSIDFNNFETVYLPDYLLCNLIIKN